MLVVFGSINADLIFRVANLPAAGQTVQSHGLTVEAGGKGANQAVAAALDGVQVMMAGAVGEDQLAETALASLRAAGVDLHRVAVVPGATGCAAICTDQDGRNQIVVEPGANHAASASAVEDALLGPGVTIVTQMEAGVAETAALIRRAHASGARTIHNLAPAAALPPDALRLLDLLVVNEDEAAWLAAHEGAARSDAVTLHVVLGITVVRTLGQGGLEWAGREGTGHIAAAPVQAVDTTAAGDCFVGVLAAALDRGAAVEVALYRANQAAGLACTRHGSQGSLPRAADTDQAIMQRSLPQ